MNLELIRYAYHHTVTLGGLRVGEKAFFTLERPWIKHSEKGGLPFKSCVPDGTYDLIPFTRANGDEVYALANAELGVWVRKEDRPNGWGRYEILIHPANWASQLGGCIAPGLHYKIDQYGRHMVTNSRAAMNEIMEELKGLPGNTLTIRHIRGTGE